MSRKIKITFLSVVLICGLCGATAAFSLPIYTGVDMGYVHVSSGDGFEITPYIGISPISSLPDLSFEFDLALSFPAFSYSYTFSDNLTLSSAAQAYIVSPQLFAVYTVDKWFIKPFAGVGIGYNINNANYDLDLSNSFSVAAKAGAKIFIPRTSIFLGGVLKFNLNQSTIDLGYYDNLIDLNLNAWSVNVSFGYKFK